MGSASRLAQELNRPDIYRQAAENMVRLEPHQPVPRGYLASALLEHESGRAEAKQHLRAALEFSPEYSYATMRLLELHIEDKEFAEAQQILELGGEHLPTGYLSAFKTQLLAVQDSAQDPPVIRPMNSFVSGLSKIFPTQFHWPGLSMPSNLAWATN